MWNNVRNKGTMLAMAGAVAVASITSAVAAPLPTNTAAVKPANSSNIVDVRWRGGGGAVVAGLAAGVIGAAAANAYGPRYYGAPYGYYGGYYGPAYGYYGYPAYRHYGWRGGHRYAYRHHR